MSRGKLHTWQQLAEILLKTFSSRNSQQKVQTKAAANPFHVHMRGPSEMRQHVEIGFKTSVKEVLMLGPYQVWQLEECHAIHVAHSNLFFFC